MKMRNMSANQYLRSAAFPKNMPKIPARPNRNATSPTKGIGSAILNSRIITQTISIAPPSQSPPRVSTGPRLAACSAKYRAMKGTRNPWL